MWRLNDMIEFIFVLSILWYLIGVSTTKNNNNNFEIITLLYYHNNYNSASLLQAIEVQANQFRVRGHMQMMVVCRDLFQRRLLLILERTQTGHHPRRYSDVVHLDAVRPVATHNRPRGDHCDGDVPGTHVGHYLIARIGSQIEETQRPIPMGRDEGCGRGRPNHIQRHLGLAFQRAHRACLSVHYG